MAAVADFDCELALAFAVTHGRIGPSHIIDQTVATQGCAMRLTNADGYFNRVRYRPFADGIYLESCANLMASAHGSNF
jgi:hypothetical protein